MSDIKVNIQPDGAVQDGAKWGVLGEGDKLPVTYPEISFRGNDNYNNSLQYIQEQLYPLNYNNTEDFNTLKMKIWVLDGPVRQEEMEEDGSTPDIDVTQPFNHWETLLNDLTYLDKYIRTEDDLLEENEENFDMFWERRIQQKSKFLNTIKDEETGEYYQDYEQAYNQRPTLLKKDDFETLYGLYKEKEENGEWAKALDIVGKITGYCIDIESFRAEQAVLNDIPPEEMESQLKVKAEENIEINDRNYVNEMQDIHDELLNIIISTNPSTEADPEDPESTSITAEYLINLPTKRQMVSIDNNDTHKGVIIETSGLQQGGYRFVYRNTLGSSVSPPSVSPYDDGGSWNKFNELENTWEDVTWARVNEITTGEHTEYELVSMGRVADLLDSVEDSELTIGENSIERFSELNDRWININNLREYKISNTGTRVIIESMVTANIPELLSDKIKHFNDKREQKKFYTRILRERQEEFI